MFQKRNVEIIRITKKMMFFKILKMKKFYKRKRKTLKIIKRINKIIRKLIESMIQKK